MVLSFLDSRIELHGLEFYAYHGVLPQEAEIGNRFRVDLSVTYNFGAACETDDVQDTINYATLYHIVEREMCTPSRLLEHLLGRIARAIESEFPSATACEIRITKCTPPIQGLMQGAAVFASVSLGKREKE